jgi:hypothetical protein
MMDVPQSLLDGRYRVVGVLGEGAQATTFDAVDERSGLAVAVKRFRVHGARSWKDVELAEREATVLSTLSHPLLPRYVEHFEDRGELFLVTEKIEGESLSSLRRRGVAFEEADVERLLRDAAEALHYLHGRTPPIVHRDLKPSNILRRLDGSFAFIDFGSVRDRMKPEGGSTVVGTFGYMAPEQFQGRAMPASDVYSIGATALSLLTRREPEDLPHRGLGIDVAAALSGLRVRPRLVEMLSVMLAPAPDERVQTIGPLWGKAEPAPERRRKDPPREHAPKDRRDPWKVAGLCLVACGTLVWLTRQCIARGVPWITVVVVDVACLSFLLERATRRARPLLGRWRKDLPREDAPRDPWKVGGLGLAACGALVWLTGQCIARGVPWITVVVMDMACLSFLLRFLLKRAPRRARIELIRIAEERPRARIRQAETEEDSSAEEGSEEPNTVRRTTRE